MVILWAVTVSWGAVAEPTPRFGNHFVVLLDDSGDMSRFLKKLQAELPDFLYEAEGGRPRFDPSHDTLSMVFFSIHTDGAAQSACPKQREYSALPEHIFEFVEFDTARVRTKESFAQLLREELGRPCRLQGRLSPIVTATSLVLPELDRRLPAGQRFGRTILVNATNGFFNTKTSPGYELRHLGNTNDDHDAGLVFKNKTAAQEKIEAVAHLFRFASPKEWNRQYVIDKNSVLYLNVFEVVPLVPTPEVLLSYPARVDLDRIATSPEKLRVGSQIPGQAELHVDLPKGGRKGGHLEPVELFWRFADQGGEPWRVGSTVLPQEEIRLDLGQCEICREDEENGKWVIPMLRLAGELELEPRDRTLRDVGALEFSVVFRYSNDSYDAISLETSPQRIAFHPVPPEVIPGGTFFSDTVLDNQTLAGLWRPSDSNSPAGGLTQEVAKNRVLDQRNREQLNILIFSVLGAILLVAAILFLFYKTAYHRPFAPLLEWQSAREVLIDFSQPSVSRLLAGTLLVRNPTEVPWFGRRLGNEEQPTRNAWLEIVSPAFDALGLVIDEEKGIVIGFPGRSGDSAGEALKAQSEEPISDGKRIHVFLASETIRDWVSGGSDTSVDAEIPLELEVRMTWHSGARDRGEARTLDQRIRFVLRILPEAPTEPEVSFEPSSREKLYYRHGQKVEVGHFLFRSRARHRFALPYEGEYYLRASREHRPLGGDPIALAEKRLSLASKQKRGIPALIHCDGEVITNPDPSVQSYELKLVGAMHSPSSQPGPHRVILHRDPTRAEVDLRVSYQGEEHEIFWTPEGESRHRPWRDGEAGDALAMAPKGHVFPRHFAFGFGEDTPSPNVLRLQVGNTATSGRGWVEVKVAHRLILADHFKERFHTSAGYTADDVVGLFDRGRPLAGDGTKPHFHVEEGEAPQTLDLRLDPSRIKRIDGARIPADKCWIEVRLDVEVRDDQENETQRTVNLYVPLELEQLPGLNWLCIDFGTSAIAAAIGNCSNSSFQMIRLQDVELRGEKSYGTEEPENSEAGTPFLPSWVICNADQRLEVPSEEFKGWPAGFSLHRPASLRPGDPSFLGLPALRSDLRERPGRIVFSLKSWLGKASSSIRLQEKVRFQKNGKEVTESLLPLDPVVESSLAALAETYLGKGRVKADQIAICHPNTFTEKHKERLHSIARRALTRRLGIAAPHHIALVSESDAVAFHYCNQRMEKEPRSGSERLMVYDFGAGTLDISILKIDWRKEPFQPEGWTVEGRIGVPVAGNYFDEILARIIDRHLRQDEVLANEALLYKYPMVGKKLPADRQEQKRHRDAIYWIWEQIKVAKHVWDGKSPFTVDVGDPTAVKGPVVLDQYKGDSLPDTAPDPAKPGIWVRDQGIALSLPVGFVHWDPVLVDFLDFVTETVVEEALFSAGVKADQIDTLLVSGRGALWPGLRDRLHARFPAADKPELLEDDVSMKEAVARGAIALQGLIFGAGRKGADRSEARLGVLVGDNELVPEEAWGPDRPIDLSSSPTFRIVQVGLRNPNPRKDMKSLRKHFYIDLDERVYRRETLWQKDPHLFIEKERVGDELTIFLRNRDGQDISAFGDAVAPAAQPPRPPWPVGRILLDPSEWRR